MTAPGRLDPTTGALSGPDIVHTVRSVGDLAGLFADAEAARALADRPLYETWSTPVPETPDLQYSTTRIWPGDVSGECFMTRGHFHTDPRRGEFVTTLAGEGELVLMDRRGAVRTEPLRPGSIHLIDGALAHRAVNTGDDPLVFLVVWMSDCGHDYESIAASGFGLRVYRDGAGRPPNLAE